MKTQQQEMLLNQIHKLEQDDHNEEQKPNENDQKEFKVLKKMAVWGLKETSEEENDKVLTARLNKFFLYNLTKDKALDHMDERPGVDINHPEIAIDHTKLLVYGTDFMNKHKIEDYFQLKGETVVIMNESSTKIMAETPERIREILERVLVNKEDLENLNSLGWVALTPYYEQGFERRIEARLATNKDQINKTKGLKEFVEIEAKKQFIEKLRNKPKEIHKHYNKPERRGYNIYEKRHNYSSNVSLNKSQGNLSFSNNNINQSNPIQIDSDSEEDNCNQSESVNNFEHSLSLDLSVIHNTSNPSIYEEPRNIHRFNKFHKFSYKSYQEEQERKEREVKNEIKVIALDEE